MKIVIREIRREGLDFEDQLTQEKLGLLKEDVCCPEPIVIHAHVQRVKETILAHVEVQPVFILPCSRCLDDVEYRAKEEMDFDYELETGIEEIDLGEDVRQELILRLPSRILCQESCKGMCLGCGVNLNREVCGCKNKT